MEAQEKIDKWGMTQQKASRPHFVAAVFLDAAAVLATATPTVAVDGLESLR